MKRGIRSNLAATSTRGPKRWAFFCGMLGFLLLPFMPVQFTSILTAAVWIFSGIPYAIVFTILGTFRLDSVPIYAGINNILGLILPVSLSAFSQAIAILVMFSGNLATAYFFKRVLGGKLVNRLPRY